MNNFTSASILSATISSDISIALNSSHFQIIIQSSIEIVDASLLQNVLSIIRTQLLQAESNINYLSAFQVIFGLSARQTNSLIFIDKNEFSLTLNVNNTAESIFVALLLRCLELEPYFNDKINANYWGVAFDGKLRINTIEFFMLNKVSVLDTYEIQDFNNNVNLLDY